MVGEEVLNQFRDIGCRHVHRWILLKVTLCKFHIIQLFARTRQKYGSISCCSWSCQRTSVQRLANQIWHNIQCGTAQGLLCRKCERLYASPAELSNSSSQFYKNHPVLYSIMQYLKHCIICRNIFTLKSDNLNAQEVSSLPYKLLNSIFMNSIILELFKNTGLLYIANYWIKIPFGVYIMLNYWADIAIKFLKYNIHLLRL